MIPYDAPKTKAGFVHWGDSYGEMAALTEPQMRAFECLMRDAPKTTTGTARKGRSTYICDHEVVLSAIAVNALEKRGLVKDIPRGFIGAWYWQVEPTERGHTAWARRKVWAMTQAHVKILHETLEQFANDLIADLKTQKREIDGLVPPLGMSMHFSGWKTGRLESIDDAIKTVRRARARNRRRAA